MKDIKYALTFDDVLLKPQYSEVVPSETNVATKFSKNISLKSPIVSASMDTVTESALAIALAQAGGIGVIHKNLSIEQQAEEVAKVKRSESGMIVNPMTLSPMDTVGKALSAMKEYGYSGFPVVDKKGKVLGIITSRDLRFEKQMALSVSKVMTKQPVKALVGITMEKARLILQKYKVEKLLLVDKQNFLKGMITVKDMQKAVKTPLATKDKMGRLRVAASVGATGDFLERALELEKSGADAVSLDTAHGYTKRVLEAVKKLKASLKFADVIAGNIASGEAAKALMVAGADAVKVGMGPGSICTTRIVSGCGVPQINAIMDVVEGVKGRVPVIADGGIKYSGDIVKALAAGADSVMVGSLLAGTDEAPGEVVLFQGRSFKSYRGMGSLGAMQKGSKDRYGQESIGEFSKLVPEGIEGRVPYKGPVSRVVDQLIGGLKSGLGYSGCENLAELHRKAKFIRITNAGLKESHVHDVTITTEAPNYHLE
ncbi:MAG: IMP dehydrogenase [Candidatus Doudnabacteria bacterium]|nr:IMP dehydrogenase [Candidatus Doudnabacteria bacterium]